MSEFVCQPMSCEDAINLWGIAYCRLAGQPCDTIKECPRNNEEKVQSNVEASVQS